MKEIIITIYVLTFLICLIGIILGWKEKDKEVFKHWFQLLFLSLLFAPIILAIFSFYFCWYMIKERFE